MDKFWSGVAILILVAVVLLVTAPGQFLGESGDIRFTDIETECRLGAAESDISLRGDSIRFSGNFPTPHPSADLDYNYRKTADSLTLDILVDDTESSETRDFLDDCLASAVYDARTSSLEPGNYHITLKHNGRTVQNQVIEIK